MIYWSSPYSLELICLQPKCILPLNITSSGTSLRHAEFHALSRSTHGIKKFWSVLELSQKMHIEVGAEEWNRLDQRWLSFSTRSSQAVSQTIAILLLPYCTNFHIDSALRSREPNSDQRPIGKVTIPPFRTLGRLAIKYAQLCGIVNDMIKANSS